MTLTLRTKLIYLKYAKERSFALYADYELEGFTRRRKHYPAWPYAGAKELIRENNYNAFRMALQASVDIKQGRGFADAYDIIDKANN